MAISLLSCDKFYRLTANIDCQWRIMMLRLLALVLASLTLSGCGTLVTRTLLDMNRLDPFTADPGGFAVGISTEAGLSLIEGSVAWSFEAIHSPSGEVRRLDVNVGPKVPQLAG